MLLVEWYWHVCGTRMCVILAASCGAVWSDEGNYAEMCRRVPPTPLLPFPPSILCASYEAEL